MSILSHILNKTRERKIIEETREELHNLQEQQKVGYKPPELFLKEARCYTSLKQHEKALNIYRALSTNPSFPDEVRAEAYAKAGMIEKDVEKLSKAIDLNEKAEYLHNRAERRLAAYDCTKDESFLSQSEKDLSRCIEKDPDFYAHYELRAKERLKAGNEKGASEDIISIFETSDDLDFIEDYFRYGKLKNLVEKINNDDLKKKTIEEAFSILKEKRNNLT